MTNTLTALVDRLRAQADEHPAIANGVDVPMPAALVVIESPYAGDVKRNEAYARLCLADSLERNESPFASHLLYTQPGVLDDSDPIERAKGIFAGFRWQRMADLVAVYDDLGISSGMALGIVHARESDVEVVHRKLPEHVMADFYETYGVTSREVPADAPKKSKPKREEEPAAKPQTTFNPGEAVREIGRGRIGAVRRAWITGSGAERVHVDWNDKTDSEHDAATLARAREAKL